MTCRAAEEFVCGDEATIASQRGHADMCGHSLDWFDGCGLLREGEKQRGILDGERKRVKGEGAEGLGLRLPLGLMHATGGACMYNMRVSLMESGRGSRLTASL